MADSKLSRETTPTHTEKKMYVTNTHKEEK